MPFPMPQDPGFLLEYCKEWLHDAHYRYDRGMKASAQESARTAAQLYMKLPRGFSDPDFEKFYQETVKKIYS